MTTVLVVSDTHGDLSFVVRALDAHPEVERVLHLGDHCEDAFSLAEMGRVPVTVVRGNGDFDCPHGCPVETLETVEGHHLLLVHGHRYDVKNGLARLTAHARLQYPPVDAVLFGHTHRPLRRIDGSDGTHDSQGTGGDPDLRPLLLVNPGTARAHVPFGTASPSAVLLHIGPEGGPAGISTEWVLPD